MMKINNSYRVIMLVFLLLGTIEVSFAQREAQYTQYMYNTTMINPAYAGSREALSIFGGHRNQWVGLDGAPVTNTFSLHTPFREGSKVGLGVSFMNDAIGPSDFNSLSADFSYTIDAGPNSKIAFGLKGTVNLLNVDYTKLSIYDPSDPRFQNNIDNRFSPNVGAGVYWYGERFYAGFSVPNFLETKFYEGNKESVVVDKMHYYLMGGYVLDISDNIKFKPAVLAKMVPGSPLQTDVSANFMFLNKFTLGAAWRWDAAVSAMAGFQISDRIFVGYAYDAETTQLADYNSGSHEILLRFELINLSKIDRVISPRFF